MTTQETTKEFDELRALVEKQRASRTTTLRCEKRGCFDCILTINVGMARERTEIRCPYMIHDRVSFRRKGADE
jgi:hypothetical protein